MPRNPMILEQMRERQKRMFRIALDPTRYGLTLRALEIDSGLGYDSLRNYASGETIMPITALDSLVGVVPDELLSLLLPDGRVILCIPDGVDIEEVAERAQSLLVEKGKFHHPESEDGPALSSGERLKLVEKVAGLKAAAA